MVVLQALLDRHAMLRLRVGEDGAGGLVIAGARSRGRCDAADLLCQVAELSDEAVVAARSRLNPAAGAMLSALWVGDQRVSWR